MKKFTFFHSLVILLTSYFIFPLYGSHLPGTLVKTTKGAVSIEKIDCGNCVVGFNDQAQTAAESFIELQVNELHYSLQNQWYIISLENEDLYVSHDQKFFDVTTQNWVKARNLKANSVLIDMYGNLHQCLEITICNKPCMMCDISIDAPHFYFTGATQILTHNIEHLIFRWENVEMAKKVVITSAMVVVTIWDFFKHMKHERRERHVARNAQQQQQQLPPQQQQQPAPESPAPQQNPEPDKEPERKECEYKDVTEPQSRYPNVKTDVTREEFEKGLEQVGWTQLEKGGGKVTEFEKDGIRYVTRDNAKSTEGPTADYYKPGSGCADIKIRLQQ